MQKLSIFFARFFLLLSLSFLIFACSRLTQENFDSIKPNMSMQEVISILGEPTQSESINIAGISGTSASWKNKTVEIDIQFLNDKVTVKSFSKIEDKAKQDEEREVL